MFISKNIFLLLLLLSSLSVCLLWLSVSLSGLSVYCFSVCQVYLSVWVSVSLVYSSFRSVRLFLLSVCMVCLSLFCLSFFLTVGLGRLSVCSVCFSGLSGLFSVLFVFLLAFHGCFVCLSVWFVGILSVSLSVSISMKFASIRLAGHLQFSLFFCLVYLSVLSFFIVYQSLSLISFSVSLYIFLVYLFLCSSIC